MNVFEWMVGGVAVVLWAVGVVLGLVGLFVVVVVMVGIGAVMRRTDDAIDVDDDEDGAS